MFKIGLGSTVKDKVTGFVGVATSRTEFLYGCIRYGVQPTKLSKDKVPGDVVYIDEDQLKVIKKADLTKGKWDRPGGPRPNPQRAPDVKR